jgi:small multidrug resistance family-3 protein
LLPGPLYVEDLDLHLDDDPVRIHGDGRGGPLSYDAAHHRRPSYCAAAGVQIDIHQLRCVASVGGGAGAAWAGVRGVIALGLYGFVATLQPDAHFGRILAAYGGVFVVGSLLWGVVADGFRPDRWGVVGALVCLAGVLVIMYTPRG